MRKAAKKETAKKPNAGKKPGGEKEEVMIGIDRGAATPDCDRSMAREGGFSDRARYRRAWAWDR